MYKTNNLMINLLFLIHLSVSFLLLNYFITCAFKNVSNCSLINDPGSGETISMVWERPATTRQTNSLPFSAQTSLLFFGFFLTETKFPSKMLQSDSRLLDWFLPFVFESCQVPHSWHQQLDFEQINWLARATESLLLHTLWHWRSTKSSFFGFLDFGCL